MNSIFGPAARLILGTAITIAGCAPSSTGGPSDPNDLNLGVNNQSGRRISVEFTIGGVLQPAFSVNPGAYVTDEFPGGTAGVAITIKATTNDGNPVLTGTRQCTPKSTIFGSSEYGQIDVGVGIAGSIACQDPNTWQ